MVIDMSKTMDKYFQDLHLAEFGNEEEGIEENPREVVKLLKRALKWKTFSRLEDVCIYLGYEDDERIESIEGCKSIIMDNVESWEHEI